jgi:WD40 repeat protein
MSTSAACPNCQQPLPVDAPHGLCPACLARAAVAESNAPVSADLSRQTGIVGEAVITAPQGIPAVGQHVRYIGDYELIDEIARGGMGVVFKARQVSLNRVVALKMILAGSFAAAEDVKRFRTEAENAAALDHPHIVPIYEVGEHAGQPYFSMKLIEGPSLAHWLADIPPAHHGEAAQQKAAARLVALVARAVHHAHQRGVLHRDLKPANVLLQIAPPTGHGSSDPQPHVTDFGLAKRTEGGATASRSGSIVGTPAYMAPEQARGEKGLSVAADIWSLGAILYEALTGRVPFHGDTPMDVLLQVVDQEPARPRALNAAMDQDLEIICLKCLEKEPGRRYTSAAALADDLERWLRSEPITARPAGKLERFAKWVRRRPAVAALAAALFLVTLLGVAGIVWKYLDAEHQRSKAEGLADEYRIQKNRAQEVGEQLAVTVTREKQAHKDADDALRLSVRRHYGVSVLLAQSAHDKLQVGQARRALDATEPHLRGWEWRYLDQAIDTSRRTLRPDRDVAAGLRFAANGKTLGWMSNFVGPCWMDLDRPEGLRTVYGRSGYGLTVGDRVPNVDFTADLAYAAIYKPDGLALWKTSEKEPVPLGPPRPRAAGFAFMGAVAFSRDGRRLFAAGENRLACWDRDQRKELWSFPIETDQAWCIAVSSDEKLAAVGFPDDMVVHVYDIADRKEVFRTEKHLNAPSWAMFTRDGKRLITHCAFRNPKVYDLETKKQILENKAYWAHAAALSADDKVGALGMSGGDVVLFDVKTGKDLRTLRGHNAFVNTVAFSPDGTLLASGGRDKAIKLWDVKKGILIRTLVGHTDAVNALAFSPDGRTLVSGANDYTLKFWDLADVPPARQLALPLSGEVRCWHYLKDSRRLLIGGWWFGSGPERTTGRVDVWNVDTGAIERTIGPHGPHVTAMSLSTDERWLVTGSPDGTLKLWDFAKGSEVRSHFKPLPENQRFLNAAAVYATSIRPDGSSYAAGLGNGDLVVWDRATGAELWRAKRRSPAAWGLSGEEKEASMQFKTLHYTPDGRHLITMASYGDRLVTIYEADTGKKVFGSARLSREAKWALSKDGQFLAVGSTEKGGVTVYDFGCKEARTLKEFGNVTALAFSPDGKQLAIGACVRAWDDPSIKLVDWQSGRTLRTMRGHESVVSDLAFLPDGSRFVSGSFDHTVKLWDPNSGQELLSLPMGPYPDPRVEHVLVSPDGRRISATDGHPEAGAGPRVTVMIWSVKP